MQDLSKSQKARIGIRTFKTLADALTLRGYYKPSGKSGEKLSESLKMLNPEIYGSMSDPRIIELQGLEYVIDRMPRGIERCNRIILTAQEDLHKTSFERVMPFKRRRDSYVVSEKEICFVVTRGQTEIYDILTHITYLNIEAQKIHQQICHKEGGTCVEWHDLEKTTQNKQPLEEAELDQALWNMSIILGRTYHETRDTYESLGKSHRAGYNNGLFDIIYSMGKRIIDEAESRDNLLTVYFTPSLQEVLGLHQYSSQWASSVQAKLYSLHLQNRPLHLISANLHSVKNILYGKGALQENGQDIPEDLYDMVGALGGKDSIIDEYAGKNGFVFHKDKSGSNIGVMVIDPLEISWDQVHPSLNINKEYLLAEKPVIVVIDYAFGTQAFEILDEFIAPCQIEGKIISFRIDSISVMGKAGILSGKKGDIMLATAYVMEGTPNNYIVDNDLVIEDFSEDVDVYVGPMVTVLGTSLQNRDVLQRFHGSSWKAVGLEMEGGHYQRAINAGIIQNHLSQGLKTRYAYYASDNPLKSGQTLASGPMGSEGVVPTYMITKVILEKILSPAGYSDENT